MFTLAFAQRASSHRAVGSGRSAGRSSVSKAERRQPSSFLKGRSFSFSTSSAIAMFRSSSVKKVRLRRHARIHRCCHQHRALDLRLVARLAGTRRHDR
jgi:hypothetical protein